MKRTFNLLSEVLALSLSELFFQEDILAEQIRVTQENNRRLSDRSVMLSKLINEMSGKVAGHVDLHANLINLSELQDLINFIYDAEDIICMAEYRKESLRSSLDIANHYYFLLFMRTAKTFLTNQNGMVTFKYFPGSHELNAHTRHYLFTSSDAYWVRDLLGSDFETNRIEAWHSLLQCIPSDLLVSAYAVSLVPKEDTAKKRTACMQILHQFGDGIHITDAILNPVLAKGLAETHLHAGASRSFGMIWEEILLAAANGNEVLESDYIPVFTGKVLKSDSRTWAREAVVVRSLLAAYLGSDIESDKRDFQTFLRSGSIAPKYLGAILRATNDLTTEGKTEVKFAAIKSGIGLFLRSFARPSGYGYLATVLGLPKSLITADVGFAERCFLAWAILHIYEHPGDISFTAVFLYYLRIKNIFYRFRVQDSKNKGLSYFKRYYSQSTDIGEQAPPHRMTNIILTAIQDRRIQKIELRFGPPFPEGRKGIGSRYITRSIQINIQEQLKLLIRQHVYAIVLLYGGSVLDDNQRAGAIDDFLQHWAITLRHILQGQTGVLKQLLKEYGVPVESVHQHRLGIIYHFIKQGEKQEDPTCFAKTGCITELDRHAVFSFGKTRYFCQAAVHAISAVRRLSPEVSRLIVGIDAASLELPTEPWVFSPAFRLARELEAFPGYTGEGQGAKTLLGITYHVGEEFRHPLSGLRHIFEAVTFYKMHAGDRLGHALALGIDNDRWFSNHGLITLPQIEWMEDCLWAWDIISGTSEKENAAEFISFLKRQILSCADDIYGCLDGISVEKLYHAYKNKTLDYQDLVSLRDDWRRRHRPQMIDCAGCRDAGNFFPCVQSGDWPSGNWWGEDSLTLSYHCGFYKHRMNREIIKEPTLEELELTKRLQKYLRTQIAMKGIIVEENPSSNAVIGEMDGVLSHPVCDLRLEKDPTAAVMASINTDDPSVFNSSVPNEHGLVYFTLIHKGCSAEQALKIVDELRQIGLDSSFIREDIPFEMLLLEYERVLRVLM